MNTKLKTILIAAVLVSIIFSSAGFPSQTTYAQTPSQPDLAFTNSGWHTTTGGYQDQYVTRYSDRVVLNCTAGVGVVLEYNLPVNYDGSIRFDFSTTSSNMAYLFTVRQTNPQRGVNVGFRNNLTDYEGQVIGNKFFYDTDMNSIPATRANSYVNQQPRNLINTISFKITPKGGYAQVNDINLAYLQSNKDKPGVTQIF